MKGITSILLLLFISLISLTAAEKKDTLVMGWEPWPPFSVLDSSGTLSGLDIEIMKAVMNEAGYTLEFRQVPWARLLVELEEGKIHLAASAIKSKEREKYAHFSTPYQTETYVLFVKKGTAKNYSIAQMEELFNSNFILGVIRGQDYGEKFNILMKSTMGTIQIEEVTLNKHNHKKLLAGRIDGFIEEYSTMMNREVYKEVEPLMISSKNNLHVMFSKEATTPEMVNKYNQALKAIRKKGTYQKIFEKYNLSGYNMLSE